MTETTLTLTAFLEQRLAEDEAIARAARWVGRETYGPGVRWADQCDREELVTATALGFACPTCHAEIGATCLAMIPPAHSPKPSSGLHGQRKHLASAELRRRGGDAHIARHDPARVLAEVAAKREVLAHHRPWELVEEDGRAERGCDTCGRDEDDRYCCPTLRALASVHADHEDYRDEWRL